MKGFITGLRSGEGGARQLQADGRVKNGGSLCTATRGGLINKMPIIDWTDKDIKDFINEYNVPLSKAYTEQGYERTGCFLCPYSLQLRDKLVKLHKYEPLRYKAAMHWLKDVYIAQGVILPFDAECETETFTCIVDKINIRKAPSTKGKLTGDWYEKGMSVRYDGYVKREGYVWISWIGKDGTRRWMAAGTLKNGVRDKSYGTFGV